jgi:hypothetical protein
MEEVFTKDVERTSRSRFRSYTDISMASSLHHHYAFQVGASVPGDIRYWYLDSMWPDLAQRLESLENRRGQDAFCVNDTVATESDLTRIEPVVRRFLSSYFAVPSPYEQ